MHIHIYIHVYVSSFTYVCMYVYMYGCMCICIQICKDCTCYSSGLPGWLVAAMVADPVWGGWSPEIPDTSVQRAPCSCMGYTWASKGLPYHIFATCLYATIYLEPSVLKELGPKVQNRYALVRDTYFCFRNSLP